MQQGTRHRGDLEEDLSSQKEKQPQSLYNGNKLGESQKQMKEKKKKLVWLRPSEWWGDGQEMRMVDKMGARCAESMGHGKEPG